MSYVVKKVNNTYKIFDTKNQKFIEKSFQKKEADQIARKLNLGSGFGSLIPDFFNVEYPAVYK